MKKYVSYDENYLNFAWINVKVKMSLLNKKFEAMNEILVEELLRVNSEKICCRCLGQNLFKRTKSSQCKSKFKTRLNTSRILLNGQYSMVNKEVWLLRILSMAKAKFKSTST